MRKECVKEAATIEEAKALIAAELECDVADITFDVVQEPQKKTFGLFGGAKAIVKGVVETEQSPAEPAKEYLLQVLATMNVEVGVDIQQDEDENGCTLMIDGEDLGFIIGRRGDTLDALQYLVGLVANRGREAYYRVTLDIGNYREKREQSLGEDALLRIRRELSEATTAQAEAALSREYEGLVRDVAETEAALTPLLERFPKGIPAPEDLEAAAERMEQAARLDSRLPETDADRKAAETAARMAERFAEGVPTAEDFTLRGADLDRLMTADNELRGTALTHEEETLLAQLNTQLAHGISEEAALNQWREQIAELTALQHTRPTLEPTSEDKSALDTLDAYFAEGVPDREDLDRAEQKLNRSEALRRENLQLSAAVPAAVKNVDGTRYIDKYGGHRLSVMCPTTKLWQKKLDDLCDTMENEIGVNALYLDQISASMPAPCFDRTHGHPLGGGSHWTEGYRELMKTIREKAVKRGVALTSVMTGLQAVCMLIFSLLYTPCVAAIASIRRELGNRYALGVVFWQCFIAWIAACVVHLIVMLITGA